MSDTGHHIDIVLFAAVPYVAFVIFLVGTIYRYRKQSFSYSSLSSQFLENREHFWGVVPFHYGILTVLAGHFIAFLIPREILLWNHHPLRRLILEVAALAFALLTLIGLVAALYRRASNHRVRRVTTGSDWILYGILTVQIVSGIAVALVYPWGSSWYASSMAPYLWSLLFLSPDIGYITGMPLLVKVHVVNAWLLIGFFPFTRLVHVLVVPNPYLWRKPQVVRWYSRPNAGANGIAKGLERIMSVQGKRQ